MKICFFTILTCALFGVIASCTSDPTKCECQAELNKVLDNAARTGNPETTDLSDKCEQLYGVNGFINENCPENK